MHPTGRFIIVDGITGSGKSTVLKAVRSWAHTQGHTIFNLHDWDKTHPPSIEDVQDADVLFTFEPTKTWVGSAIRYEMSQKAHPYPGAVLAQAFALDRMIHYRRLILPALAAGKTIIQDRGVTSSIVYQPAMPNSISLEELLELPGNKLALEHAPDALILTSVEPEVASQRILSRTDDPKGVFAEVDFLRKQKEGFESDWFQNMFKERGTTLHTLDTSGTQQASEENATAIIKHLLTTR